MLERFVDAHVLSCFSALQRAEIAEIIPKPFVDAGFPCFSALQRAEIAEIKEGGQQWRGLRSGFSALQRAEIAEIKVLVVPRGLRGRFQCSSTSRNC